MGIITQFDNDQRMRLEAISLKWENLSKPLLSWFQRSRRNASQEILVGRSNVLYHGNSGIETQQDSYQTHRDCGSILSVYRGPSQTETQYEQ